MTGSYDAILIGAGHNTLAAALHLAAKGWRVAVFEQASEPGGAVKTGEYTLPGFRHDWAAMNLSLFAGSPFFKAYGDELQRHGLEFVPVADCFASVFPDESWLGVSTDLAATTARIAAVSTDGRRDVANGWWQASPPRPRISSGFSAARCRYVHSHISCLKRFGRKGLAARSTWARFLLSSPRDWLTETFESDKVRAMLGRLGHASRFRARCRRRRAVSLSRRHGEPELRHGAGQGRRRHDHRRALVGGDQGARRDGGVQRARRAHPPRRTAAATGVELADGRQIDGNAGR